MAGNISATAVGDPHALRVAKHLVEQYNYVIAESGVRGWKEVKVDPFPTGIGKKATKFVFPTGGETARGDFLVSQDGKTWKVIEAKYSAKAPYTTQQEIHYKNINRLGGKMTFKGRILKGTAPKGFTVRETLTIYSSDLDALETGRIGWDELEKERVNTVSKTQNARKISERAVKELKFPKEFDVSTPKSRVASKVHRVANKLRPGFIGSIIIEIGIQLILSPFKSKLAQVNLEGLSREYNDVIYHKHLRIHIEASVKQGKGGEIVKHPEARRRGIDKSPYYWSVKYKVRMRLMADDPSDVVVFFIEGMKFVEIYDGIEFDEKDISHHMYEPKKMLDKRRLGMKGAFVRYEYIQHILVWHPDVYSMYEALKLQRDKLLLLIEEVVSVVWKKKQEDWIVTFHQKLIELVKGFDFYQARHWTLSRTNVPKERIKELNKLDNALSTANALYMVTKFWNEHKIALLKMYLETDPFAYRLKVEEQREQKEAQRKQEKMTNLLRNLRPG